MDYEAQKKIEQADANRYYATVITYVSMAVLVALSLLDVVAAWRCWHTTDAGLTWLLPVNCAAVVLFGILLGNRFALRRAAGRHCANCGRCD